MYVNVFFLLVFLFSPLFSSHEIPNFKALCEETRKELEQQRDMMTLRSLTDIVDDGLDSERQQRVGDAQRMSLPGCASYLNNNLYERALRQINGGKLPLSQEAKETIVSSLFFGCTSYEHAQIVLQNFNDSVQLQKGTLDFIYSNLQREFVGSAV